MNRTTILLDPSAMKESSCCLRLDRILIQGYTSAINSSDIEYGSAFHLYRQVMVKSTSPSADAAHIEGVIAALRYFKQTPMSVKFNKQFLTATHLRETCDAYDEHYRINGMEDWEVVRWPDGKPMVELRVPLPYYVTPEGDIEVLLLGTIDEICQHRQSGEYAIKDYKTTSVWDTKKYFAGYRLSTQLMFYKYLLQSYAKLFPTSSLAKVTSGGNIGCFIDGVFLGSNKKTGFERSEVFRFDESKMQEFEKGIKSVVEKLVYYTRNPSELYREGMLNSSCEKVYGACKFAEVCGVPDEETGKMILANEFVKRPYDPMQHGATLIKL